MKQQILHKFKKSARALSALLIALYALAMMGDMAVYTSHALHHHFTSTPKNHFHKNLYTPHHHHSDFIDKLLALVTGDVETDSQNPAVIAESQTLGKHAPAAAWHLPDLFFTDRETRFIGEIFNEVYLQKPTPPPERSV